MKNKELKIKLEELPNRPESISKDNLSKIFGGCKSWWEVCKKSSECCPNLRCIPVTVVVPTCG